MKRKVNSIDYLRVIATLLVFMLHTLLFTSRIAGADRVAVFRHYFFLYTPAWAGVWIFLIISGYLVGNAFVTNKYRLNKKGLMMFYTSKLIKIVIPTLFFAFICYVIGYPKFATENNEILIKLLTFRYKGTPGSDGLGATWYISTIMQLFFISPLAIYLIEKIKSKKGSVILFWKLWFFIIIVGLVVRLILFKVGADWNSKVYTPSVTNLDLFFTGILMNYLPKPNKKKLKAVIIWMFFWAMILLNCFIYSRETITTYFIYQYLFPSVYAIIVTLLIYYSVDFSETRIIHIINKIIFWFSNNSFQFYLWHSLILSTICNRITVYGVLSTHIKLLGIGFFLTAIISTFFTSLFNNLLKPLYTKTIEQII